MANVSIKTKLTDVIAIVSLILLFFAGSMVVEKVKTHTNLKTPMSLLSYL